MNYYKFIGDVEQYNLILILRNDRGCIVGLNDDPYWAGDLTCWKPLSNVELLIEIYNGTPIFIYDGTWAKKEL
jgi:hypothetical protein